MAGLLAGRKRHPVATDPVDSPAGSASRNHVDGDRRPVPQTKQGRGCLVRDDCSLSAGERCGPHPAVNADVWMPHRKDAAERGVEVPGRDRMGNRGIGDAQIT